MKGHSHSYLGRDMRAIECERCDWEERQSDLAARRRRERARQPQPLIQPHDWEWVGPEHERPIVRDCYICERPIRGIWYYERRRPRMQNGERCGSWIESSHVSCIKDAKLTPTEGTTPITTDTP